MREYPNVYIVLDGEDTIIKVFYNESEADAFVNSYKGGWNDYFISGPHRVE